MDKRLNAFTEAFVLVERITEKHQPFEQYRIGQVLSTSSVMTPVDQHISHILTVADWLLEGNE